MSCFRSLHDGVGGSWRIGSKKLFMPFRAPTSHGNTPFRTTFRHPFHPANITRTLLSTWILSAFEVPYVLRLIQSYVVFLQHQIHSSIRYVGSMGSMKRLRTTKVLCADHECWLLIIQFRLFICLFIDYLFIQLFIYSFIYYCLFLCFRCFPFFLFIDEQIVRRYF